MAKEVIKFLKTRDVKSPSRAYSFDAGIDFYVPKFNKSFVKDLKEKNPKIFNKETPYNGMFGLTGTSCCNSTMSTSNVSYNLNDNNETIFKFDDEEGKLYFLLPPHSSILIPSGIHSRMSAPGRALIASNKSGIASKNGLVYGAQVVDYTYQGEIHLNLINTSTSVVRIYEDMKILQFLETPIFTNPIEVTEGESMLIPVFYEGMVNDRGADGFGSTNKK